MAKKVTEAAVVKALGVEFAPEANTGFYRPDGGEIAFSAGGERVDVPEKPYILVEESRGGEAYRLDTPEAFEPRERGVTVDGVRYEHCAEDVNGRWVYRAAR